MQIKNIAEIREEIEKYTQNGEKQLIFRGESRCEDDKGNTREISSALYRQLYRQKENIIKDTSKIDIEEIKRETRYILEKVRNYVRSIDDKDDLKILSELQHYGGNTNFIDFSQDFLVALFFACFGNANQDGRLILFDKKQLEELKDNKSYDINKDFIFEPQLEDQRVLVQKSIFVHMQKGYIESIDKRIKIIKISKEAKQKILDELKNYHNIKQDKIYHYKNLQSFIRDIDKFKTNEAYFYTGLDHQKAGRYEEAITYHTKAIELNPKLVVAYNGRGAAKAGLNQYDEALEDFNKAIELYPNFAEAYSNRGNAKKSLKQYEAALKDYDKAIELDPNNAVAYYNRGIFKYYLEQYEEAYYDYTKAIELDPNYVVAYNNRGLAKAALGGQAKDKDKQKKYFEAAIKDYTKAIELDPNYAVAYNNRGAAKADLKQYEAAIKDYTKAIELDPNYAVAYYNRGNAKAKLKQYEAACDDYNKALELDSNYAMAYSNRGLAKASLEQYEAALEDFNKAIELDPNDAEAYYNRGLAKGILGEQAADKEDKKQYFEAALEDYNQALVIDPNDQGAIHNKKLIEQALEAFNQTP